MKTTEERKKLTGNSEQNGGGRKERPFISGYFKALPAGIWALGFVSMFMDTSSELIHSLLPVFMSSVLGASMVTIGLIEGISEAAAAFIKVFSGAISDYLGRRKLLAVIGYGLAALTKPVFPLAASINWVFAARFVDRIGKGIRGAPRDALVSDLAPAQLRGAAYGLRQSLDSVGAFLGPLIALSFMFAFNDHIRAVMWIASLPALAAVAILLLGVHDPERPPKAAAVRNPLTLRDAKRLPPLFWLVVLLGAIFTLARFSEAFLVLRAREVGLAMGLVPLVFVVMNIFYTLTAYPAGVAADHVSQRTLLILGLLFLIGSDIVFAVANSSGPAFVGAALWGIHMGLSQGLFAKLVADTAPAELLGSGFGIFNLVSGAALLLASSIAGLLWTSYGAPAAFIAGAFFAAAAAAGLLLYGKRRSA